MDLTHKERMQACLGNDSALDRSPVALWRHFPVDDQSPDSLIAATLHFQNTYDFDIVKVTPASSFCLRDWGVEDIWTGNAEGTREYTRRVINSPIDWENLPLLSPDSPHLSEQLTCLKQIRKTLGTETPLLQTVFSPLAQAKNLSGGEMLLNHLRQYPQAVQKGLDIITESTRRFIEAAISTGIDGIFYAVQHAQTSLLTEEEFLAFGKPDDVSLLNSAADLWCNMIHLHGTEIRFNTVADYPAQIVNWHDRDSRLSLAEGLNLFSGAVCGGLRRETVALGDRQAVTAEARQARAQTQDKRFILGTGCVVPVIAPHGNYLAVKEVVQ